MVSYLVLLAAVIAMSLSLGSLAFHQELARVVLPVVASSCFASTQTNGTQMSIDYTIASPLILTGLLIYLLLPLLQLTWGDTTNVKACYLITRQLAQACQVPTHAHCSKEGGS